MLHTQRSLLNGGNKIPVFLSCRQGMDSVKDLLTFVLYAETDLCHWVIKADLAQIP